MKKFLFLLGVGCLILSSCSEANDKNSLSNLKYAFYFAGMGSYTTREAESGLVYQDIMGVSTELKFNSENNPSKLIELESEFYVPTFSGFYKETEEAYINSTNINLGQDIMIQEMLVNNSGYLSNKKLWFNLYNGFISDKGKIKGSIRFGTRTETITTELIYEGIPTTIGNNGDIIFYIAEHIDYSNLSESKENPKQFLCMIAPSIESKSMTQNCEQLLGYNENNKNLSAVSYPASSNMIFIDNYLYFVDKTTDLTDFYNGFSKDGSSYPTKNALRLIKINLDNLNNYEEIGLDEWISDNGLESNLDYHELANGVQTSDFEYIDNKFIYLAHKNFYIVDFNAGETTKIPIPTEIIKYYNKKITVDGIYFITQEDIGAPQYISLVSFDGELISQELINIDDPNKYIVDLYIYNKETD